MLNMLIIVKILLLFYIDWNSYINNISLIKILIFSILYITFIIFSVISDKKYEKFFSLLEGAVSIITAILYAPMAIILFSVSTMEFFLFSMKKEILAVLIPLAIIIIPMDSKILVPSLTIVLLVFIILRNIYKNIVKFNILINTVEKQRKQIAHMESKLKEEQSIREQFLYTTKLEEIHNVTNSLNEKVGQTISGALLQLEAIKIMITQDSEGSKVILGRAIKNLKDGLENIKGIIKSIKPTDGELGINRIKLLLEENTKNTGMRFKVTFNGDLDSINSWHWKFLMDTVNELSRNSIQYSKGDFIHVNLSVLEQNIRLQVSDNGIGAINIIKGSGLLTIEEHLKEFDGRVILKDESGFTVIVFVPLVAIAV